MSSPLDGLTNQELLAATNALVRRGRQLEVELLLHLGEVDSRRLYLDEACPSMFAYCVRALHFSEAAAYKRIRAARAARSHPQLLDALRRGEIHVTAVSLLAAQLTEESCGALIQAARHKTAEEIKRLLADRQPKPDVRDHVRRIPFTRPAGKASEAGSPPATKKPVAEPALAIDRAAALPGAKAPKSEPLGGERYRVCFTANGETHAQLQELRALMRHQVRDGDIASILGQAVALLLDQVRRQKFAAVSKPKTAPLAKRAASRRIPAAIRRAVARRDRERCSFVSPHGLRCGTQEFLEFHHLDPWARSGTHSIDGIALRCRAHNQYAAEQDFGEEHMARFRGRVR